MDAVTEVLLDRSQQTDRLTRLIVLSVAAHAALLAAVAVAPRLFPQTDEIRLEILQERMKQALLEQAEKSVFVRADAGVTMQQFMSVTDKLKEAGVEKVAIGTRTAGSKQ